MVRTPELHPGRLDANVEAPRRTARSWPSVSILSTAIEAGTRPPDQIVQRHALDLHGLSPRAVVRLARAARGCETADAPRRRAFLRAASPWYPRTLASIRQARVRAPGGSLLQDANSSARPARRRASTSKPAFEEQRQRETALSAHVHRRPTSRPRAERCIRSRLHELTRVHGQPMIGGDIDRTPDPADIHLERITLPSRRPGLGDECPDGLTARCSRRERIRSTTRVAIDSRVTGPRTRIVTFGTAG